MFPYQFNPSQAHAVVVQPETRVQNGLYGLHGVNEPHRAYNLNGLHESHGAYGRNRHCEVMAVCQQSGLIGLHGLNGLNVKCGVAVGDGRNAPTSRIETEEGNNNVNRLLTFTFQCTAGNPTASRVTRASRASRLPCKAVLAGAGRATRATRGPQTTPGLLSPKTGKAGRLTITPQADFHAARSPLLRGGVVMVAKLCPHSSMNPTLGLAVKACLVRDKAWLPVGNRVEKLKKSTS